MGEQNNIAVLSDDVPLVVSRQLLQSFAQELGRLEAETQKEIALFTLTQIQPRVVSFEEQVLIVLLLSILYGGKAMYIGVAYTNLFWQALVIREKLAALYESEQEWSRAAQMLSGIDLDSGMRYDSEGRAAKFYSFFFVSLLLFSCLFWVLCHSYSGPLTKTSSSPSVSKSLVCISRFAFPFNRFSSFFMYL